MLLHHAYAKALLSKIQSRDVSYINLGDFALVYGSREFFYSSIKPGLGFYTTPWNGPNITYVLSCCNIKAILLIGLEYSILLYNIEFIVLLEPFKTLQQQFFNHKLELFGYISILHSHINADI